MYSMAKKSWPWSWPTSWMWTMFGVPQPGGRLGLGLKAADQLGRGQVAGQDHLHRHRAIEALLPGLVDHAHAAAADLADQFVGPEVARQRADGRLTPAAGLAKRGFSGRRRQHLQRFQAIQRRGQFRDAPQQRSPIRLLARLKLRPDRRPSSSAASRSPASSLMRS